MALNIKDPQTDQLARDLARETGETITEAIRLALAQRLERVRAANPANSVYDRLMAIAARGRALTALDDRSDEEILGYDDFGIPR